jgi:hypothetical protein
MFKELDTVALTRDVADEGLKAGDIGAIVHAYRQTPSVRSEIARLQMCGRWRDDGEMVR